MRNLRLPSKICWQLDGGAKPLFEYHQINGVTITHFPVIHYRKGSIGYKLEWSGLSTIYRRDTRPATVIIQQVQNSGKGVDVFIHEMMPRGGLG